MTVIEGDKIARDAKTEQLGELLIGKACVAMGGAEPSGVERDRDSTECFDVAAAGMADEGKAVVMGRITSCFGSISVMTKA